MVPVEVFGAGGEWILMFLNGQARELGRDPVWAHLYVRHALALGLGTADFDLEVTGIPQPLLDAIGAELANGSP